VTKTCDVTWQDAGRNHTSSVDFGGATIADGAPVHLRVHGNRATLSTPAWEGYVAVALGLALAGLGVFFVLRTRRRAALPTGP
jgi:MYXO-CTERM domain-containing protein